MSKVTLRTPSGVGNLIYRRVVKSIFLQINKNLSDTSNVTPPPLTSKETHPLELWI